MIDREKQVSRRMSGKLKSWCVAVALLHAWAAVACQGAEPLRLVETIPLPGVEGRIDHMAIDEDGGRLFIAALANNSLEVVDLVAGKVERSIGGLHGPQGVAFLKDRGLIAVASGDDGECRLFDAKSFAASGHDWFWGGC